MTFRGLLLLVAYCFCCNYGFSEEIRVTNNLTYSEIGLNHTPMCLDNSGNVHLVWCEQNAPRGNYQVMYSFWDGDAFSEAQEIVQYPANFPGGLGGAKYPSICMEPEDTLHIVWHDYRIDGINNIELFTKSRVPGKSWDPDTLADIRLTTTFHPETNGDNGYLPVVKPDIRGNLHLIWYDYRFDGQNSEIMYKMRKKGGTWDTSPGDTADIRVTNSSGNSYNQDLALDENGSIYLVYADNSDGIYKIYFLYHDFESGCFGEKPIIISESSYPCNYPCCSISSDNELNVVWVQSGENGTSLFLRQRSPEGNWNSPIRLTPEEWFALDPGICRDSKGNMHLVWSDLRVSLLNREIFYRLKRPGALWDTTGTEDIKISNGNLISSNPGLVANDNGRVYFAWKDFRFGVPEIYFNFVDTETKINDQKSDAPASNFQNLLAITPNPFNPDVMIHVRTPESGNLHLPPLSPVYSEVAVYDLTGRLIKSLFIGELAQGDFFFRWDGKNELNAGACSGIYVFVFKYGESRYSLKGILLK